MGYYLLILDMRTEIIDHVIDKVVYDAEKHHDDLHRCLPGHWFLLCCPHCCVSFILLMIYTISGTYGTKITGSRSHNNINLL